MNLCGLAPRGVLPLKWPDSDASALRTSDGKCTCFYGVMILSARSGAIIWKCLRFQV